MKKILFISSLILSTLIADNSLGTPISTGTLKPHVKMKSYNKTITTTPKPKNHKAFKKDHHRYDKRYKNFNYENNAYYNNDGYYYGYYDNTGYFYNNIFFTYNSRYSYSDRQFQRGYFRPTYTHHRVYEHHIVNDWNRVHCYAEPNTIIYNHYYDVPSYQQNYRTGYSQNYNHPRDNYRRDTARMYQPRRDATHRNTNQYRHNNNNHYQENHSRNNPIRDREYNNGGQSYHRDNTRGLFNHNSYRSNNSHRDNNQYRNHSGSTRMTTRNSPSYRENRSERKPQRSGTTHMQLAR